MNFSKYIPIWVSIKVFNIMIYLIAIIDIGIASLMKIKKKGAAQVINSLKTINRQINQTTLNQLLLRRCDIVLYFRDNSTKTNGFLTYKRMTYS